MDFEVEEEICDVQDTLPHALHETLVLPSVHGAVVSSALAPNLVPDCTGTALLLNHVTAVSVRVVTHNALELALTHTFAPCTIAFCTSVWSGVATAQAALVCVLTNATVLMLRVVRGEGGALGLEDVCRLTLDLPPGALDQGACFTQDLLRPSLLCLAAGRAILVRFALDPATGMQMRADEVKWKGAAASAPAAGAAVASSAPTASAAGAASGVGGSGPASGGGGTAGASGGGGGPGSAAIVVGGAPPLGGFLRFNPGWTLYTVQHASTSRALVQTHVLKEENRTTFFTSLLSLKIGPLPLGVEDVYFVPLTTTCVVASASGNAVLTSFANGAMRETLELAPSGPGALARLWLIADAGVWVAAVGVALFLVSVDPGGTNLAALPLGNVSAPPTTVTLLSSPAYKQGAAHLVYLGAATGPSTVTCIVPGNPAGKRLTHQVEVVSLAPVRGLARSPLRGGGLLVAHGSDEASGLASVCSVVGFSKLVRWKQVVDDAWRLPNDALALQCGGQLRVVRALGDGLVEVGAACWPMEPNPVLALTSVFGGYIAVTRAGLEWRSGNGDGRSKVTPFPSPATAAAAADSVLLAQLQGDGMLHRFAVEMDGSTRPIGHPTAGLPAGASHLSALSGHIVLCLHQGQLLWSTATTGWAVVPSQGSHVYVALSVCPSADGPTRSMALLMCKQSAPDRPLKYGVALLDVQSNAQQFVTRPVALIALPALDAPGTGPLDASLRFVRPGLVSVRLHGQSFVCHQVATAPHYVVDRSQHELHVLASTHFAPPIAVCRDSTDGSLCLGTYPRTVHAVSALHRHGRTVTHITAMPRARLLALADVEARVVLVDATNAFPQSREVASYSCPARSLVSDLQLFVSGSQELLVMASCRRGDDRTAAASRLTYTERRITILSFSQALGALTQAASHHPIDWAGVGSCVLMARSLPAYPGRLVVASDTLVCVYHYDGATPRATLLCSLDLTVIGNDLVSSVSVFHNLVSISHMFGALAVVNFADANGAYSLHCTGTMPGGDGLVALLSRDFALASDTRQGLALMSRVGASLSVVETLALDGSVSALSADPLEHGGVVFVGTRLGALYAVRALGSNWKVLAEEAASASPNAIVVNGNALREKLLAGAVKERKEVVAALQWFSPQ